MGRKIIIQDRINEPSDFSFKYVFWADVPSQRHSFYADATKTSVVKDATQAEIDAIRSGAILEKQDKAEYLAGTTASVIKSDLISKFNDYQDQVNSLNPWKFYGTSWDGTTWTNGGVS